MGVAVAEVTALPSIEQYHYESLIARCCTRAWEAALADCPEDCLDYRNRQISGGMPFSCDQDVIDFFEDLIARSDGMRLTAAIMAALLPRGTHVPTR